MPAADRTVRTRKQQQADPNAYNESLYKGKYEISTSPASDDLTIKGAKPDPDQQRNMEQVISTASAAPGASKRAILACLAAVITETAGRNLPYGPGDAEGILQVLKSMHPDVDPMNIDQCVTKFMTKGFTGAGSAIAVARQNPQMSIGVLAQTIQASAYPDGYKPWVKEARAWYEAFSGGFLPSGNQEYTKQFQYYRDKNESNWDCIQRLAGDVQWRAFFVGKAMYFMSETLLFQRRVRYTLKKGDPSVIELEYDMDWGKPVNEVTLTVTLERWGAPPGAVIMIAGWGPPDGRWLITDVERDWFSPIATVTLKQPQQPLVEKREDKVSYTSGGNTVDEKDGAKSIVTQAFHIAQQFGQNIYVASSYRPGSTTTGGNVSDHSKNDSSRAARDIAVRGVDALVGPPQPELDKACVAIGKAFGRNYGTGKTGAFQNADTFTWHGFRIQIIWRTPQWGGHMGHIHVGARKA